jgi:hypothetical protein
VSDQERRAPVQGEGYRTHEPGYKPRGTIAWSEHLEVFEGYAKRYGRDQSAERIAERGGFGWNECVMFLGREPTTWRSRLCPERNPQPMTDDDLLGYALIHCETERALFSIDHVRRLYELAGEPDPGLPTTGVGFVSCGPDVVRPLVTAARERMTPTQRGTAGDRCELGNECGRLGCPECQQ